MAGNAVGSITGGLGDGVGKLGKGDFVGGVGSIGGGVQKGVGGLLGGVFGGGQEGKDEK